MKGNWQLSKKGKGQLSSPKSIFEALALKPRIGYKKTLTRKFIKYLKTKDAKDIRVPAKKFTGERFGSGLDEMYPTRLLKDNPSQFSNRDLELLYFERVRTSSLIWVTDDGKSLAGHPGALKYHQRTETKGMITEEHNTRDNLRESAIRVEGNNVNRTIIKARLGTIKYMQSPGEDFLTQEINKELQNRKQPIYHGQINTLDLRDQSERAKLAPNIQLIREQLKWSVAEEMLKDPAIASLVPQDYKQHLNAGKTAEQARTDFENSLVANPSKRLGRNRDIRSQTDDLRMSLSMMAKNNKRSLSRPRSVQF